MACTGPPSQWDAVLISEVSDERNKQCVILPRPVSPTQSLNLHYFLTSDLLGLDLNGERSSIKSRAPSAHLQGPAGILGSV